jgi:DNA/RNA-binding protein KIN17
MNATKWPSLTEFAKHLGREGICRVEENDKGIHISWIDNSPDALRRQEALKRKEAQAQGDEEMEQRMIREQIRRAQANAEKVGETADEDAQDRELKRQEGEKITLSFGSKPKPADTGAEKGSHEKDAAADNAAPPTDSDKTEEKSHQAAAKPSGFGGISLKAGKPQTKNVFAQAKKNALVGGSKKPGKIEQPKKMSEAERIMRQEMDRKRSRESADFSMSFGNEKKPKSG